MRFSIIIPNYNGEKYIDECLKSIFNQTISKDKYEVLFIDDGSDDNSLNIVSNYDVKVFKTNRKRAGGARNKGLDNASGEYILFLDSDDYFYSNDVLEKLDNFITDEDCINLPFVREQYDKTIQIYSDKGMTIEEKLEKTKILACYSKCLKNEFVKNIRFKENCYYEDVDFTMQVLCHINKESDFEYPVVFYRLVEGSMTRTKEISPKKMTDVLLQIAGLYYLCDEFPKYSKYIHKRIKNDKLKLRIDILDDYFEKGINRFDEEFRSSKK